MFGVLAILAGAIGDAHAQANLVSNGDFKANAAPFGTWPGYTGGANPASITSWNNIFGSGVGVNGAAVSFAPPNPFSPADDGGNTYAFIQGGTGELAQNLLLTINRTYRLDFDAAGRAGNTTVFRVQIGDNSQVYVASGDLTASNAAFNHYSYTFTAPGSFNGTPSIQLYNLTAGDNTVDFANVSVARNFISFDDVASGTVINNHYPGLRFTNELGGNVVVRSSTRAPSSPNAVSISTTSPDGAFDARIGAVDVFFATPMRSVSIDVRPVGPPSGNLTPLVSRPYIQAFDVNFNYLGTVYYAGPLPTNCCSDTGPTETLTFVSASNTNDIAAVLFTSQGPGTNAVNQPTLGIFDNLRYDDGSYILTVNSVGSGVVSTTPFQGSYFYGSVVTLSAAPSLGWSFSGWSGNASGTANPLFITMIADTTVTATFVPTPQPGPNYVVTKTDDHDDGVAGVFDCTLREAINAANANTNSNTITFAPGVTGQILLQLGELVILHDLTIAGPGPTVLAVSGNNSSRVFNAFSGSILISDLTITNGRVNGFAGSTGSTPGGTGGSGGIALGGGIICQTTTMTVSNCLITGSSVIGGTGGPGGADAFGTPAGTGGPGGVGEGGGVYNGAGTLTLVKCTISGNTVSGGTGGVGASASDNFNGATGGAGATGTGGGLVNGSGTLVLNNCTVAGNTSSGGSGGVGGGSTFHRNGAAGGAGGNGTGGGLENLNFLLVANCTISSNNTIGGAGGLGGPGGFGASAGPNGAIGSALGGGVHTTATLNVVQNDLIAGNSGLDCSGTFASQGYNLIGVADGATGFTVTGDQTGTSGTPLLALLGPLQFNGGSLPTMKLLPGSPAIDKGKTGATTDERGRLRPYDFLSIANAPGGDGSDIGAYEVNLPVLNIAKLSGNVVLSWSTNEAGFTLESAAQLAPTTIWATVPGAPAIVGSQYTVTTNTVAGKQFYRLNGP